jgi:uncharacterized protein YrrD
MVLQPGTPVYSSDGKKLGEVEHVLADADLDVFDGFVVDTSVLPGGNRFVDAPQVDEVYERGVVLNVDAVAAESLPKPSANPAEMDVDADDMAAESPLREKLSRAWDRISGNY